MNGVQWEGDVAFLIQGTQRPQTAFDFEVPCPFEPPKGACDHRIDLRSAYHDDRIPTDLPLVHALSPVPKGLVGGPAYLASDDFQIVVATLARMSSPSRLPIAPFWSITPDKVIRALEQTNVQPLVLTGVQPKDRANLDRILEAAPLMPRRLLLQGSPHVILRPGTTKITTTLGGADLTDFVSLPWEAYGAHILKRHMLKLE